MECPGKIEWSDAIQRGWILILLETFESLPETHPELKHLRHPNLAISDDMSTTLGHWDEDRRLITLSARLFDECAWQSVNAVFLHEIAHQVVSEIYGITDAVPHGAAFSRACAMLGIPDSARMELPTGGRSPGAMMNKIHKLLALGQSANPHEAELALSKAQELALAHNIRLRDSGEGPEAARFAMRLVGPLFSRVPNWIWSISNLVADYYFVLYICRTHYGEHPAFENGRYRQIELYGTLENLDMAEYVFYYLLHQGETLWRQYREAEGLRNNRMKISYLNGVYEGFEKTLEQRRQALAEEKALIWLGDPELETFYRQRNPRVRTERGHHQWYETAHRSGVSAGRNLRLNQGIGRSRGKGGAPKGLIEGR